MPWAIALILFANWALGLGSGARLGWWVHLLFLAGTVSAAMGLVGSLSRSRAQQTDRRRAAARARKAQSAPEAGPPPVPGE